jgi:diguanylate cyclase (GGDEF)-like protein
MLEHLSDGVVFVDHKQRVKMWSRGAEKATGITPNVVLDRQLLPQTINLCDTVGNGLQLDKCPVARSLRTLEIVSGEYKISNGTSSEGMKVELTVIPVIDKNRYVNGAVVMFHDRTAQVNLQQQLKDLYEFSVLDPLTQVANRAEFERVQQEYVLAFQQSDDFNCSIIICDIDFFKSINDNFGHKVGDEALMSFAEMLKRYVRPQDLVARYGGEEFVILCADCDTAAAVQRAEEIRMALYKTPQPMLGGKSISASFGVSELREGDTATDFFVRADTALLKAKESGRNRVVAGDGSSPNKSDEPATELSATGIRWSAQQRKSKALLCEEFKTETPIQVLVEKLRGYIIENDAVLQRVEPEFLSMEIEVEAPSDYSKKGAFTMNVEFKEDEEPISDTGRTKTLNYIRVTIYAGRMRSWFSTNHTDLAPHLLGELRRFLMIGDKASRISVDMATQKVR